jgi:hypothetical protein
LVRARLTVALVAAGALWGAPAALASSSSSTSANWAGYAIHQSNTKFTKVVGRWTQPSLECTRGQSAYSAYWIGLGGYNENSDALEQIGTEADCSASGVARMSAWYELVPAPSRSLKLAVHGGDTLAASVTVTGHTVRLTLEDVTIHKTVVKTLHSSELDLTSAEWIAEAPSECVSDNACQTLPLADFGSTSFSFASAETSTGRKGTISNRAWDSTKITLVAGGHRFVGFGGGGGGEATPSNLTDAGSAFSVAYSDGGEPGGPYVATDLRSAELAR